MGLLQRYVIRQLAGPFIFALSALTSIMLLNQVARRFGHLVGRGLDWSVIGEVFALSIPFIVAMTMPMAVLIAVLYTFTHLAADSEITAMRASGVSVGQLLAPVVMAGLALSLADFIFVDQVLPRTNARLRTLLFDIARKKPTLELDEQIINQIPPSRLFLRSSRIDPNTGRLKDVVIYDLTSQDRPRIIYADSGRMAQADNQQDMSLQLYHGEIHEYETEDSWSFRLTVFDRNTVLVRNVSNELERGRTETIRGDRELSTCEMRDIVVQAHREAEQSRRNRTRFLREDVRALLGLPALEGLEPSGTVWPRRLCDTWESTVQLLLPRTAEAQERAQDTPAQRKARMDSLRAAQAQRGGPEGARQSAVDALLDKRARTDSVRSAGEIPPAEAIVPPPNIRDVTVTSWADISASKDVELVSTRKADAYSVEIHKKWAISTACLVFVLMGIPLALRFPRGGMGLVFGGGLTIFTIYYIGLTAGESLGDLGKADPWILMWAPNIILSLVGLFGLARVKRFSGTARGGELADLWRSATRLFRRDGATA